MSATATGTSAPDAVVVGSGPNGLAAAVTVAQAGMSVLVLEASDSIGGGARTGELTVGGLRHDVCSAVHPLGAASPFLSALPLQRHGLRWRWPEIDLAHPLDGGRAGVMVRSLDATEAGLGRDGRAWARLFGPLAGSFDDLAADVLRPLLRIPRHPVSVARFGAVAVLPATLLARRFATDEARALLCGMSAHAMRPLSRPGTAAFGAMLGSVCHAGGWPVAAGGSGAITDALAGLLGELGAAIETGVRVTSLAQLPRSRLTFLDVSPRALVRIAGDRLPPRSRRAYERWRYGPGVFKIDLAVRGGIPWAADPCRRAGTVHVGGTLEEIVSAEAEVHRGRMPRRPFVLVAQQYLCDPQRSAGDLHPVWVYAHVPAGFDGDVTETVLDQVERFAPGLRGRVVARHAMTPKAIEAHNESYVGGDIATGANDLRQTVLRPRVTLHPYATGIPGVFLCSAATPPGAGVHGLCGYHAACSALRWLWASDA